MADFDLSAAFIPSLHKPSSLLPIAKHRQNLLYLIEKYPVIIVVGETGSGKTTQIPQYLDQAGWCADGKSIAVTQVGELGFHNSSCPYAHVGLTELNDASLDGLRRRQLPPEWPRRWSVNSGKMWATPSDLRI